MYLYFLQFLDPAGSVKKGALLFEEKECANCHFPHDKSEEMIAPDLATRNWKNPIVIAAAMWNHATDIEEAMNELEIRWPRFEREEMNDLIMYILSLQS